MKTKNFIVHFIIFLLVALAFLVMVMSSRIFLIVSAIFYVAGGLFEWIMMKKFYVPLNPLKKKRSFPIKISEGFIWVHEMVFFMIIKRTTIYDFKRLGYIPSISAYIIMLFYVLIAYILYPITSYIAFLIYLIPVITNISFLIKYSGKIKQYRDILKKK